MSNRVRVLVRHAEYGPFMGGKALRVIEQKFEAFQMRRASRLILPADFGEWPRWKRAGWMVKRLGHNWKFQAFREPRGTKAGKAAFWQAAQAAGFTLPKRRKPQPAQPQRPRFFVAGAGARHAGRLAQGNQLPPADPRQPGRIPNLDELLRDAARIRAAEPAFIPPAARPEAVQGVGVQGGLDELRAVYRWVAVNWNEVEPEPAPKLEEF